MRAENFCFIGAGLIIALFLWREVNSQLTPEIPFEPNSKPPGAAALCPWRSPDGDLRTFFPEGNRRETETKILSSHRLEIQAALKRPMEPDENALHLHRIYHDQSLLGTVMTRRVKGEFGGIEIVLAADREGRVRGVCLQRLREPQPIADELENKMWLNAFVGKTAADLLQLGSDLPAVRPDAETSARAVVEGARGLLVMLAIAEKSESRAAPGRHH